MFFAFLLLLSFRPSISLLQEKDLVHKLFKVLVPRYSTYHTSCTQMWNLPTEYPGKGIPMAILELKGKLADKACNTSLNAVYYYSDV